MDFRVLSTLLLSLLCGGSGAWPIESVELADLAGRVQHGYYAADEPVLLGALEMIGRVGGIGLTPYYEALASYRLAQLNRARQPEDVSRLLDRCRVRANTLTDDPRYGAEAWVLLAACAQLAGQHEPRKVLLHTRRADQALARAHVLDPKNPRLALIEGQRLRQKKVLLQALERLEFAATASSDGARAGPEWGKVEAMVQLSELNLTAGDRRRARDLIEEALLLAPEYGLAQSLRERVISGH